MLITGEVEIAAPAEEVWALLGPRFDRIADWARTVSESGVDPEAPATTSAPVAGRVCRSRVPGFAEVRERIASYDERAMEIAYELVDPPRFVARARSRWQVGPIDEHRSRVRWEGTVEPRGFIGEVLSLPLRVGLGRLAVRTAADLRSHIESGRGAPVAGPSLDQGANDEDA